MGHGTSSGRAAGGKGIENASFESRGFGDWQIDTKDGGGQILEASAPGEGKYYEVRAWDADYNMIGDVRVARTLNSAKDLVREMVKRSKKA